MPRSLFQKMLTERVVLPPAADDHPVPALLEDVEITIYEGGTYGTTNIESTIYTTESGSTQGPTAESGCSGVNPFYTANIGLAETWLEDGIYDVVIHDTEIPARVDDRVIKIQVISYEGVQALIDAAGEHEHTVTTYESYTWSISGEIEAPSGEDNYIPPMYVSVGPGETVTLKALHGRIKSGTSVTIAAQKNNSNIGGWTGWLLNTTAIAGESFTGDGDETFANLDAFGPVVSSPVGNPENMSVTAIFTRSKVLAI